MDSIESSNLFETTLARIRDAICDGTLKPNERLTQDKIAERLNVSRQPVNQALLLLKSQGFVVDAGRRGVMVAPISAERIADIYEIRIVLDSLAARRAASRKLTDEEVENGRRVLAAGQQALAQGSEGDLMRADVEFHRFVYKLSGNQFLCNIIDLHLDHLRRAMQAVIHAKSTMNYRSWTEHQAMFEALVAGDSMRAAELSSVHMRNAADLVRDVLLSTAGEAEVVN